MRSGLRAVLAWTLLLAAFAPSPSRAQGQPGDFDFYVLSLSWSPTYCASAGRRAEGMQCAGPRPFGFVAHGLWPQYERGFPSDCRAGGFPSRAVVDSMLAVMPSPGLVRHQWRKHGTCSGLGPEAFFALTRRAYERVVVPEIYRGLDRPLVTSPADVERAFIAANPGLAPSMIAVDCNRRNLREVRVCMKRDLSFRPCAEVDRRACRASELVLPPMRETRE
ncbi:ribonuclease T2 [Methylopila turkensis]|uniref:ribonuclease T2 n=1 Tax=Methylopila turkensis TaxID=1437816 RepID=UPI0022F2DDD9|nr:ribonuclease T2 [Methylopila turkensis]